MLAGDGSGAVYVLMVTDSTESANHWVGYVGWACGITGVRVAIELAADSMALVMAREELGLRRRMLMLTLESIRGGWERDMVQGWRGKRR